MIQLSKRLQCVAHMVQQKGVVADIGCDHGFTSIYLVQSGLCFRAIAMDVNAGPLALAKEHIKECMLEDCVEVRLSDGTDLLQVGEADTILISGMGGALMSNILLRHPHVTQSVSELVLSPQSEPSRVRHAMHALGFTIQKEQMVKDMGKYYVVLRGIKGYEKYSDEIEYEYGAYFVHHYDETFFEYMKHEQTRVLEILANLPKGYEGEKKNSLLQKQNDIEQMLLLQEQLQRRNQ